MAKSKRNRALPLPQLTRPRFLLLMVAIVAAALLIRGFDLEADPPGSISWSHGPFTDGAVVVHDARNLALFGDWIVDYCEDLYLFPLSNLAAAPVFQAFGVGRWQAGLPSVLFGVASIALVALGIGRTGGFVLAALTALLGAVNYFLIMYQRIPLAEPAMVFLLAATFYFWCLAGERPWALIVAGFCAMAAPLFGKAHAYYFPLVLLGAIYLEGRVRGGAVGGKFRLAAIGLLAALVAWLGSVYVRGGDYVLAHVFHESLDKHEGGPGIAAEFIQNFFAMGAYTNMFDLMPAATILAIAGVAARFARGWKAFLSTDRGTQFLMLWLIIGWIAIAAVRLPAPRYVSALCLPFLFLAAESLTHLYAGLSIRWKRPVSTAAKLGTILFILWATYQPFVGNQNVQIDFLESKAPGIYDLFLPNDNYSEFVILCFVEAALVTAVVVALLFRSREIRISPAPTTIRRFGVAILAFYLVSNLWTWGSWAGERTHYLRDGSTDLAEWIGPGARLMGSFAPALGLDNSLPVYPYYGGLGDSDVFHEYGITHVVVSTQGDHQFVRENYPKLWKEIENRKVVAYPLKSRYTDTIVIYRLPQSFGGEQIHHYEETDFERAIATGTGGDWEGGLRHLEKFLERSPDNADGHYLVGFMYNQLGQRENAEGAYKRAAELRPERPRYFEELGKLYRAMGRPGEAREMLETAHRLNPRDRLIREEIGKLGGVSAGG